MAWSLPDDLPSSSERWAVGGVPRGGRGLGGRRRRRRARHGQVKLRPWSTVWRVEADQGVFFAKQNCPLQNFEAALVAELQSISPADIVPVAAVDTERGFLLTPDQGPVLGGSGRGDGPAGPGGPARRGRPGSSARSSRTWTTLETRVGLTRLRPEEAGRTSQTGSRVSPHCPAGDPRRLDPDVAVRVRARLPLVRAWAEQVVGLGLPLSLQPQRPARAQHVRHPGGPALLRLRRRPGRQPARGAARAARDRGRRRRATTRRTRGCARSPNAALEVWSDLAPLRDLRAALPAALQLAGWAAPSPGSGACPR